MEYVYNYDPDDFFYLNKTPASLDPMSKKIMIPGHATLIKPPEQYEKDEIPVFNLKLNIWEIKKDNFWRPNVRNISYNTGIKYENFPLVNENLFNHPSRGHETIPRFLNPQLFWFSIKERLKSINVRIETVLKFHTSIHSEIIINPINIFYYKTEIDTIIYFIKKTVDDIIMINYVSIFKKDIILTHEIEIDSIGKLKSNKKGLGQKINAIKEAIKYDKNEIFITMINDLHNSLKHDAFSSETVNEIGIYTPVVFAIEKKGKDLNEIVVHQHDLGQIIIGFNNFLKDNE